MDDTTTSEAHTDKCCDVCGDIGVIQAIVTCTQCKISREHLYCMRTVRYDHPENWFCEECEDLMKASSSLNNPGQLQDNSAHHNKLPRGPRRNPIDHEKKMHTGKVMLLSSDEVIRLTSRNLLPGFPVKDLFHPYTVIRKNRSVKVRNPTAIGGIPPKSNSRLVSPSELEKHFKPPIAQQQVAQSSARRTGGVVSSTTKIPVAALRSFSPLSAKPKVDKYIPASEASWKGSFNLLVRGPKRWEINGVIQAHPPSKVRRKVYESSKLIPEVLEFELVQRGSLWMNLFGNYTPDNRDIGLYFFPSTCQRCKNYTFLLEHIGEHDMVLRNYRDGLELLVFTSKILQIDCQRWDGMYFLWGLFRRTELTFTPIQAEPNHCHGEGDNNEANDMEIDMIGEQNVGRSDIAVPRIQLQVPLPCHENETYPEIPPGLTGQKYSAPSANETFAEIPPGFEKFHQPKDQDQDQRWASAAAESGISVCVKVEKPDEMDV